MMNDVVDILRRLVEIPSQSGFEDEIASFLASKLESFGLEVEADYNVVANADADFWLVTHMDTVTPKAEFRFDGSYAYGTGVCDTKGSIAAILLALGDIKDLKLGIAFLRDEEEGGKGSEVFAKEYLGKAVVMEPTSLKIAATHYGVVEVAVRVKGRPAHGSMPEYGENAIEKAVEMIGKLKSIHDLTILKIEGGGDEYVIPDVCSVKLDFLLKPGESASNLKRRIVGIVREYGEVEVLEEEADGFISGNSVTSVLETAIKKAGLGVDYTVMPSWTDAINLKTAGWDVVVWGPGELAYCHTPLERIDVREIEKASRVIVALNEIL
ncbi:M20/M25/M40 family metallo-hydrolase [Archaeoglobus veneficus]|uniref:Peptidase dimerization domain protein n=1 Tax=Archaeoglobus veneficus (strain DSM 11195 / SNP6) TaxID=693661 RepID=F2KP35_ARCVS|nr:M20/M25/M40 family metallo-hydrolase [Archaeoglobus veneficus]AEA46343.1 peptidase dimerization domain protein [Archaeoglobus veneficus SNP6]